ncbi:MAG TPA: hypothetical protein VH592_21645 [Gemmataceae bacterium]
MLGRLLQLYLQLLIGQYIGQRSLHCFFDRRANDCLHGTGQGVVHTVQDAVQTINLGPSESPAPGFSRRIDLRSKWTNRSK